MAKVFIVPINTDSKLEKTVQLCNSKTEDITMVYTEYAK